MRALIVCHGDPPSGDLLRREVSRAHLVLCTDGVAPALERASVVPDFVVGDMDSLEGAAVSATVLDAGPHEVQENSDSEKAVLLALERGADEVVLLGAMGGRLDHTVANLALAARYADRARVRIVDDLGELEVVHGRRVLRVTPGDTVSLVALSDDVRVTTQGLQWELSGPLEPGTRGVSNRAVAEEVVVDAERGAVALIALRGTN